MKTTRYQGPDIDRDTDHAPISEPTAQELTQAESDFMGALSDAGIDAELISSFCAMGPVLTHRKWEADQLQFSSPDREAAFAKALNSWGRANFR